MVATLKRLAGKKLVWMPCLIFIFNNFQENMFLFDFNSNSTLYQTYFVRFLIKIQSRPHSKMQELWFQCFLFLPDGTNVSKKKKTNIKQGEKFSKPEANVSLNILNTDCYLSNRTTLQHPEFLSRLVILGCILAWMKPHSGSIPPRILALMTRHPEQLLSLPVWREDSRATQASPLTAIS